MVVPSPNRTQNGKRGRTKWKSRAHHAGTQSKLEGKKANMEKKPPPNKMDSKQN